MPDWVYGSDTLATVTLPHRNTLTGQQTRSTNIYAFAVPLKPGATIDSVTLPDLSSAAEQSVPGLHIFGMAVRDTTAAPNGASWTGAWSSPTEERFQFTQGDFTDQTIRMAATTSVSGDSVRLRLSDALGTDPLSIDHVTVAAQASGATPSATPKDLTFNGGSKAITIPEGGEIYSDPVNMATTAGKALLVSLHLVNRVPYLVMHPWASATAGYVSAPGSGDHTADTTSTAFSGTQTVSGLFSDVLTGIDVTTADSRPTVSVLGDGLTDTQAPGGTSAIYTSPRLSDNLATRLRTNTEGIPVYGVTASGIENNYVGVYQGAGYGGRAALTRLDRDVLSIPGVKTVVVAEGQEDIIAGHADTEVEDALGLLRDQLKGWGIKTVFTTLAPCDGYAACTVAVDANRIGTNTWITDQTDFTAPAVSYVDAESIVGIPDQASVQDPPALQLGTVAPGDFDAGDHVNLSVNGYTAISDAFDLAGLGPDPS